jgi:hypothetical protein
VITSSVEEYLEGVLGRHLLLHLVEADLDPGGVRVGGRGSSEGLHGAHDALGLEVAADLGDDIALADLEGHRAAARAGVVLGAGELVGDPVDALGDGEVEAADEHRQRHEHRQAAGEATLLLGTPGAALVVDVVLDGSLVTHR